MTRVEVTADDARARVALEGDLLRPRLLSTGSREARVALVPTGALLLGGDEVRIDVVVGAGARLEVVETAGTVAYPGPRAGWHVTADLGPGAVLVWNGLPFVVCDGADVDRSTALDLADGARAVLRDTLVLGRAGERGGRLRQSARVRVAGAELLVEDLDLSPQRRAAPGVLGGYRIVDTVAAFGFRPPERSTGRPQRSLADGGGAAGRLDLAAPGALDRFVGTEAHVSPLGPTARLWGDVAWRQTDEAVTSGDVPPRRVHRPPRLDPVHA